MPFHGVAGDSGILSLKRPRLLWLLIWLCGGLASGQIVITGESNALGTLGATDLRMTGDVAGADPIDGQVPFYWDNRAGDTSAGDGALGDSGGWVTLGP